MRRAILWTLLLLSTAPVRAAIWEIDPARSRVQFTIRHMVLSDVPGEFKRLNGAVDWDPQSPAQAKIDVTIEAASVDTRNAKRDAHLRSSDFFEVEKHPNITFRSTRVEPAGNGKLRITGDLTIRGVTKSVTLAVDGPQPQGKDAQGRVRVGATATTRINRKDFGLLWNRPFDAGGLVLADEVSIRLTVELVRKS
jgi:polyisoprenoid-binding protein YceI